MYTFYQIITATQKELSANEEIVAQKPDKQLIPSQTAMQPGNAAVQDLALASTVGDMDNYTEGETVGEILHEQTIKTLRSHLQEIGVLLTNLTNVAKKVTVRYQEDVGGQSTQIRAYGAF